MTERWYDPSEFVDEAKSGRERQPEFTPESTRPSPDRRLPYLDRQTDIEGEAAYQKTMALVDGVNRIHALVVEANGG